MKFPLALGVILLLVTVAFAQKSNESIKSQIRALHAEKQLDLTYDAGSQSSKVMGRAENFSDSDAKAAGLQAMNFGLAYFYSGNSLSASPEYINFTFWAMAKKPRFAGGSHWTATVGSQSIDLGDSRYVAKPSENMEYLNFRLKRDDLARIAASSAPVKFKLGGYDFTFTPSQMTLLKNIIAVSDTR